MFLRWPANAVSAVEYLAAYVVPFAVAAALVHPHETELQCAVAVVSVCNLLIHTPRLEEWSKALGPAFVTTHGHLEHHRRMTINYAAPTINVDWIVEQLRLPTGRIDLEATYVTSSCGDRDGQQQGAGVLW
jgi:hypothetical protein